MYAKHAGVDEGEPGLGETAVGEQAGGDAFAGQRHAGDEDVPQGHPGEDVEDVLSVGQKLQVEISDIDDRGKLSLAPVVEETTEEAASE